MSPSIPGWHGVGLLRSEPCRVKEGGRFFGSICSSQLWLLDTTVMGTLKWWEGCAHRWASLKIIPSVKGLLRKGSQPGGGLWLIPSLATAGERLWVRC